MPKNLLVNPYFQLGSIGWSTYGLLLNSVETEYADPPVNYDGEFLGVAYPTLNNQIGPSLDGAFTPCESGKTYQFGMRMWLIGEGVKVKVALYFAKADYNEVVVESDWYTEDGDLLVEATAPEDECLYMYPRLLVYGPNDYEHGAYIADAFLWEAVDESEPGGSDPSGDGETPGVTPERPTPMNPDATTVPTYSRVGRLPWDRDPWVLEYPGTRLEFGTLASGMVLDAAPDYGTREFTTEDQPVPRADGRTFGQDFLNGSTITFELAVHGADEQECRRKLAVISRAWRGDAIRKQPGEVAELYSDTGRVCYGRPRRFSFDGAELPLGVALVTCDFETADDYWYDAEEKLAAITFYPDLGGGLVAPLTAPLSTTITSDRSRSFTIGGEAATWPVFEVRGPITTPKLEIVGRLELEIQTTLDERESLIIDTRPYARSVLRDNGVSNAGLITRKSTRLSDCALDPGTYELVLRGQSGMRDATAAIRWREAYAV